jgi:polysaccharide chain length determinant protein (PEP-CTERM system associated)
MSVQFRQRTPSEYLKILRRRKWLIILPVIAVTTAVAWVVFRLPDVYESSTLIVVKPSTLPTTVVSTSAEDSLTRQLSGIAQVVTSRSSLEPLIEKYELYLRERQRGEPMEGIIDMMRKDIVVQVNTSRNDITDGFDIKYRYRDPKITQAVTAELASKYVSQQTQNQVASTASARTFIDNQVKQTQDELDQIDAKRRKFMEENLGQLPSEADALLRQLTGYRDQQKALIAEVGRLQDRRSTLAGQLVLIRKTTEDNIGDYATNITDPKTTLGYAELVKQKADLQSQLQQLLTMYKPAHPDVVAKQAQIDSVQKELDMMIAEWKERIAEKEKKLKGRPDLQAEAVQAEIKNTAAEITRQQNALSQIEKQIADITDRINKVPGAEVALGALDREYQTKKAGLDALLVQQQKISLNADAASQQQSEGIEVIDAAYLPQKPVAPKRLMLSAIGLIAGLGLGLVLTGIFEVPRLLTIQSTEDARHYTGLPVLIAVPELLTPQEARALPRRRKLLLAAGVIATMVAIPLLALALRLTHVFEFLMQSSGRSA